MLRKSALGLIGTFRPKVFSTIVASPPCTSNKAGRGREGHAAGRGCDDVDITGTLPSFSKSGGSRES